MDYARFLDILLIILFLLITAGSVAAVAAFFIIKGKKPVSRIEKEELSEEPKQSLRTKSRSALTRVELEALLFDLEREKRTVTLGFNKMTDTHQEAAKVRVRKIEERLQHVRAQLANGI